MCVKRLGRDRGVPSPCMCEVGCVSVCPGQTWAVQSVDAWTAVLYAYVCAVSKGVA